MCSSALCLVEKQGKETGQTPRTMEKQAGRQFTRQASLTSRSGKRGVHRALKMERARPGRWSSCTWQKQESDQKRGGERQKTRTARMMSVNKSRRRLARPLRTLARRFFFLLFLFHLLSIHPLAPRPSDSNSDHSLTLLLTCSPGMSRDRN